MQSMALKRATEPSQNDCAEVDDVNSFLSTKIALSFDQILEEIFQSLDRNDLLNCRLVCQRWLNFAYDPLQKQIKLTFCENKKTDKSDSWIKEIVGCVHYSVPRKVLPELTNLLKKGRSLSDSEDNGHVPIMFPCNRFELKSVMISNEDIQHFLNTNGYNIQELDLDIVVPHPNHVFDELDLNNVTEDFGGEYVLMDQIGNLLLNQAPNIRSLHLEVDGLEHEQWKNPNKNLSNNFLETTDPEYQEIREKALNLLQSKPSPALKLLHLSGEYLKKISKFIIRISPNLEEAKFDSDDGTWVSDHMYLLEPENRLSLLKEFIFYLDPDGFDSISELEITEKMSFGNFKLKSVEVHISNDAVEWIEDHPDSDYQPRFTNMMNRILKGSWETIEKLSLHNVTFLKHLNLKFPEIMPKLKEIRILELMPLNEEADANRIMNVFPMGSNFQKTFPKLSSIYLYKSTKFTNVIMGFSSFLQKLNFGADPLSTSVRKVTLPCKEEIDTPNNELQSSLISQIIQQWFPNASIFNEQGFLSVDFFEK